MKVPFIDLAVQHEPLHPQILEAWAEILKSTRFVAGRDVARFEREFASAHDAEHGVAVSSGTAALELALRGLGVGPGDEVVVPANTFIATAEAVSLTGAIPRLVDCDPETRTINVEAAIEALTEPRVRGAVPVHLYGHPADMDPLVAAAARHGRFVLEDAAQAHLAQYRGQPVGGVGTASAFSFYPSKNLGAPGEGGAILTNDTGLAETVRALRDHGQASKYHSDLVGTNARMHELVASTLSIKLPHLSEWNEQRRDIAHSYAERLRGNEHIDIPNEAEWANHVYHLYVVHVPHRDRVRELMEDTGIGVGLHYPVPVHLQPAYADLGHAVGDFPVSEASAHSLLSLPMYPEMAGAAIEYVSASLIGAVERALDEAVPS